MQLWAVLTLFPGHYQATEADLLLHLYRDTYLLHRSTRTLCAAHVLAQNPVAQLWESQVLIEGAVPC